MKVAATALNIRVNKIRYRLKSREFPNYIDLSGKTPKI